MRILLADDHDLIRLGLRQLIQRADPDWSISGEAADGWQVFQQMQRCRPDLLVLDLSMPGPSGVELVSALHAMSPDTNILVLTIHEGQELIRRILAAGAKGFISKSEPADELLRAIRAVGAGKPFLTGAAASSLLSAPPVLTPRENEILALVAHGMPNSSIAARLDISVRTVEAHRAHIMRKLGLASYHDLLLYALNHGVTIHPNEQASSGRKRRRTASPDRRESAS